MYAAVVLVMYLLSTYTQSLSLYSLNVLLLFTVARVLLDLALDAGHWYALRRPCFDFCIFRLGSRILVCPLGKIKEMID